jgi:inorganic pyrophosphatase/exopolyphosphatase
MWFLQIKVKIDKTTPKFVVIGNMAGDLDSIIGSILLSILLTKFNHFPDEESKVEVEEERVFIPWLGFRKYEMEAKLEVVKHLKKCKLNYENMQSVYDIDLTGVGIVLHDHNEISPDLDGYSGHIIGIVDHHHDLGLYDDQLEFKKITMVGSATSLIVDKMLTHMPSFFDKDTTKFALAPIMVDNNLNINKLWSTFHFDSSVVSRLLEVSGGEYKQKYFQKLKKLRKDESKLIGNSYPLSNYSNLGLGWKSMIKKDFKLYAVKQKELKRRCGVMGIFSWHV